MVVGENLDAFTAGRQDAYRELTTASIPHAPAVRHIDLLNATEPAPIHSSIRAERQGVPRRNRAAGQPSHPGVRRRFGRRLKDRPRATR